MRAVLADIHVHILPGIDDGAADEAEAHAMLREAARAGIKKIYCTYHNRPGMFEPDPREVRAARGVLDDAAAEAGVELALWCEAHVEPALPRKLAEGKIITEGGAFLLELPYVSERALLELVFEVRSAGFTPVICHPERYVRGEADLAALERAKDCGALVQVNAPAVAGLNGRRERKNAMAILKAGLADALASDAHSAGTGLFDALAEADAKYGPFEIERTLAKRKK